MFLPKEMETRTFEMQSHAFSIRFLSSRDSALGCIFSSNSSSDLASKNVPDTTPKQPVAPISGGATFQQQEKVLSQNAEVDRAQV